MILSDLKSFLRLNHATNMFTLCRQFDAEPDVLRDMLALWIRKGKVKKCMKTNACGSKCFKCDPLFTEVYEWVA